MDLSVVNLPPVDRKNDRADLKVNFLEHIRYSLAKDRHTATRRDLYDALAYTLRDHLIDGWLHTQQHYYDADVKRVYYLSLEFMVGRLLTCSLLNLGLLESATGLLDQAGIQLDDLAEQEWDPGLGTGGLGRLAACFLDSMATLGIAGYGYGIRYEYGIFSQRIENGQQVEGPDNWLRYGCPWEIPRPDHLFPVRFYGRVNRYTDGNGKLRHEWVESELVMAMAHDILVPGHGNDIVNTFRLWAAKSSREFDLEYFNHGDYVRAVEDKNRTENISKVLYPKDDRVEGRELRLKQEYFLVSATLQDILRRYRKKHETLHALPEKAAIQMNDTHPALAVPELMRILMDREGFGWDEAWDITVNTCGYTNHTIMPEALEKLPVPLLEKVLPRHLEIVYEINRRLMQEVARRWPGDSERLRRMSLIEEGPEKRVRMANLAIVGSHKINGVSALHSEILKRQVFRDFYELHPERFTNKTNGITPRRWLLMANPGLSELITRTIGDRWITRLSDLEKLTKYADAADFQKEWARVKRENKRKLAILIEKEHRIAVNTESLFDVQVKRIHEYKRQLLSLLHVITLYHRIKDRPNEPVLPRTVIFAGKAAPGYLQAKLIIRLINAVADVINRDPVVGDKLKLFFLANYRVTLAERIIPAADLSEQISTAGMEASGTGNMKLSLNGALTIGTLDGANIEIKEAVGDDNIFICGHTAEELDRLRKSGYNPLDYYHRQPELRRALDAIRDNHFSPTQPGVFQPLIEILLHLGDPYFVMADFASYLAGQERINQVYANEAAWTRMSILNVARMGKFSSDRTISEYAKEIWGIEVEG